VDLQDPEMKELIKTGQYRPSSGGQALDTEETISDIWAEQPPDKHINVFVGLQGGMGNPTPVYDGGECFMSLCASSEYLTNTLAEREPEEIDRVDRLQEYKGIFVKVNKWGTFQLSDIKRNRIEDAQNLIIIPNFVTNFEQKLARKSRLHPDVRCFLDLFVCCPILTGQCRCILECRC
jgi:hypothetical protein